jgi:hypothetical protein
MIRNTSSRPHRVGDEAWLPFAEGKDGRMVHVKNVPNGKKCGCICPACRGPLIAYHPRTKKTPYFGHYTHADCDPPRALETMLHKLAKQLIEERKEVRVPPVVASLGETQSELSKGGIFRPESVRVEEAVPGMRPDIIATLGQRELFIEVAVRHKVGAEKLALIRERRHSTIEIDLAKWRHETDEAKLAQAIIYDAPRVWLFNSAASEKESALLAEQEARAQLRREHSIKLANAILPSLSAPQLMKAPPGSRFAEYVASIEDADMAEVVGVAIPGSGAFGVAERIWQAAVLHLLLRQSAVTMRYIPLDNDDYPLLSVAATKAYRDAAVDWTVVEKITEGKMRDPRAVIREYLDYLCEQDIAEFCGADQYKISWDAMFGAREAQKESQARRGRHTNLRKAFDEISHLVGGPTMTFAAWIDIQHEGIEATPRELADSSEWSLSSLLERMRRIGNLVTPDAAIVEGGLLGFPAEEHLAARKVDAERRRIEAEENKAARLAAEQARQVTEAAARLQSIRAATREIESGEALLHAPLKELDGRSIEQTEGWMSPTEFGLVWGLIRGRQDMARKKREREAAALAEAEKWREKLIQRVAELFKPEFRHSVLHSTYPETFKRKLIEYCSDERTYKVSVNVAERVRVGRN